MTFELPLQFDNLLGYWFDLDQACDLYPCASFYGVDVLLTWITLDAIDKRLDIFKKRSSEHDAAIDEIKTDNHNGFEALNIELTRITRWIDERFQQLEANWELVGHTLIATLMSPMNWGDARPRWEQPFSHAEKHVKLDVPEFRGELKPEAFLDWLSSCDIYFGWFQLPEQQKVQFATVKLKDTTYIW